MKKQTTFILVFLALFLFCFDTIQAQKLPELIPYRKGDKWGYCDSTKKIVVQCIYDETHLDFGYYWPYKVQLNGKWGAYNGYGKKIIPEECEVIRTTIDSSLIISKNNKYGIVDKNGMELLEIKYDAIEYLGNRNFRIKVADKYMLYNINKGRVLLPVYDVLYPFDINVGIGSIGNVNLSAYMRDKRMQNGKWSVYNGRVESNYDSTYEMDQYTNEYLVKNIDHNFKGYDEAMESIKTYLVKINGKVGVMDVNGKFVIPILYQRVILGYDRLKKIKVAIANGSERCAFYTWTDSVNNIKKFEFEKKYDSLCLSEYEDGVSPSNYFGSIISFKNSKKGIINSSGQEIQPPIYEHIGFQYLDDYDLYSRIYIGTLDDKLIFIDSIGKIITTVNKNKYRGMLKNVFLIIKDKKYGVIDYNGKVILPSKYEQINNDYCFKKNDFDINKYDYFLLNFNSNKLNKIKIRCEELIPLVVYNPNPLTKFYILKNKNKYGLIDKTGRKLLNVKYDSIAFFSYNIDTSYFVIKNNNSYGLFQITDKLKQILPIRYENINIQFIFPYLKNTWSGHDKAQRVLAINTLKSKKDIIDLISERCILSGNFDTIRIFNSDSGLIFYDGRLNFFDENQQRLVPEICDTIYKFQTINSFYHVSEKYKKNLIHIEGTIYELLPIYPCMFSREIYGTIFQFPLIPLVSGENVAIVNLNSGKIVITPEEYTKKIYEQINKYGYLIIDKDNETIAMDENGKKIFTLPDKTFDEIYYISGGFKGLIRVYKRNIRYNFIEHHLNKEGIRETIYKKSYHGYIDTKGTEYFED